MYISVGNHITNPDFNIHQFGKIHITPCKYASLDIGKLKRKTDYFHDHRLMDKLYFSNPNTIHVHYNCITHSFNTKPNDNCNNIVNIK